MVVEPNPKVLKPWQRYRLKDLEAYRKQKREYARTVEQRAVRSAYMRTWRENNRAKFNAQAKRSYEKNKHKHINRDRDRALRIAFGISLADKIAMIDKQRGLCAICSTQFKSTRHTHVDHDHITNRIRGILCVSCNTRLGWWEKYNEQVTVYLHGKSETEDSSAA